MSARKLTAEQFQAVVDDLASIELARTVNTRGVSVSDVLVRLVFEAERARESEAALLDALEWQLPPEAECDRCKRHGGPCVGHAAIRKAEGSR